MKKLLIIPFCIFTYLTFAQASDFILLKKRNITIATYFSGGTILFTTNTGAFMEANILRIKNDTLFLKEYIVKPVMTQLGVYILDTLGSYLHSYHYKEIFSIAKTGRHFDVGASGAALMGGGILITLASGVVFLADNKKFSPELLVAGIALGGLGYILSKQGGKGMVLGKKYKLEYIQAQSVPNNF